MEKNQQRRIDHVTRIVLRPVASPLLIAFFAFGAGSVLQSGPQLGLIPQEEIANLTLLFGAFVFPPIFLAAVFEFLSRQTLGATAIGLISFSWPGTALVTYTSAPDPTHPAMRTLNFALAVILLLLGIIGVLGKPLLAAVILLAFFRFGSNSIYELTAIGEMQTASGVLGCAIFLISPYDGFALGLEDVQHRTVLPMGRRGEARRAFEGDLGEQVDPSRKRPASANNCRSSGEPASCVEAGYWVYQLSTLHLP